MSEMQAMANLAKKIASGLVKISIAKDLFESGDFSANGIFGENSEYGKHLPNSNKMAKGPFESGDFDENGELSPKT